MNFPKIDDLHPFKHVFKIDATYLFVGETVLVHQTF